MEPFKQEPAVKYTKSRVNLLILIPILALYSCGMNTSFSVTKKYSPAELKKDYEVYRELLEDLHPSLYWYTSKDSMDMYFEDGESQLRDSLTELQFRKILTYITSKINCGHTTVRGSKKYSRYVDTANLKVFPLNVKTWQADTVVVSTNLNRKDSILRRGIVITAVNGRPVNRLVDTMFHYLSADGNNLTHKFQSLSNRASFGNLLTQLYGPSNFYTIEYLDSLGNRRSIRVPAYDPSSDTTLRALLRQAANIPAPSPEERRRRRLASVRQLRIDTANQTAFMELNSFGRGYHLKRFYRQTFKTLNQNKIPYLVIDVRSNGGGSVSNSTSISRFIARQPFKIADSLYAIRKRGRYDQYVQHHFWNRLFINFFTKRKTDRNYHFGYFERHYFKPRKKNHFKGKVYVLTGGNSFSATTLFVHAVHEQKNVIIVGEETGGAAYGNSAWLIPDVTLPKTKIRFRLPLFRLVINKNAPKDGSGFQPEVSSTPTVEAIRRNKDFKMETVLNLIKADKVK